MRRVQWFGRRSGLLLQERHRPDCECRVEVVSVVRLHLDDNIPLWWFARLPGIHLYTLHALSGSNISECHFKAAPIQSMKSQCY